MPIKCTCGRENGHHVQRASLTTSSLYMYVVSILPSTEHCPAERSTKSVYLGLPYNQNLVAHMPASCGLYVPTCIHLFPHARTDTIQVVEHEPNFSKFYPLTISFLVSQFCTLKSSLCVSSSDSYLTSPFGSSLIKVVLDPKIRTTECTHQTTSVRRMNS